MKVGVRFGCADDATRQDWDGVGPRPLSWAVWYPAADDESEHPLSVEPPDQAHFSHDAVAMDGVLNDTPQLYPVVLLSHGTGGSALGMSWLGTRLAHHGFVAIGVNHHGNTAVEPYRAEGFLCWWERARDLTVLLDHFNQKGFLAGRLDLDKVYGAGFSLGAYTIAAFLGAVTDVTLFSQANLDQRFSSGPLEFPNVGAEVGRLLKTSRVFKASWERQGADYRDLRARAALLLAPAPPIRAFIPESLRSVRIPTRIFVGGSDTEAPADTCATWLHERLPTSTLTVLGNDVGHHVFLPEATPLGREARPALCLDAHGVDRRSIHDSVTASAVELFDAA